MGTVHELRGWRWGAFWPAALGLDLYYRTLRVRYRSADLETLRGLPGPCLFVLWHNHSLIFPRLVRPLDRGRIHTLISASKMAAWEVAYYRHQGIPVIRGSSTRGGAVAVKQALRHLRAGDHVALSPDGPSGPLHTVQRGVAMIARHSGARLVLLGAHAPGARRLDTWDRHLVPWPGQRIEVRAHVFHSFSELGARDDLDACVKIRRALLEIGPD